MTEGPGRLAEPATEHARPALGARYEIMRSAVALRNLSHYEILEQIAEGGMGVVYKARDVKLDRLVALKLLSATLSASSEEVERLFEEARALSRLNHPSVATIYEAEDGADKPFMAMEYLPGATLRSKVRKSGNNGPRLSPKAVSSTRDRSVVD